jgi:hypothetical protein
MLAIAPDPTCVGSSIFVFAIIIPHFYF